MAKVASAKVASAKWSKPNELKDQIHLSEMPSMSHKQLDGRIKSHL